jgi:hypothetical protein
VNGDKKFPIPEDAYFMVGAGEQFTIMIPSHDLVVVRIGRYAGHRPSQAALRKSLALLMELIPATK